MAGYTIRDTGDIYLQRVANYTIVALTKILRCRNSSHTDSASRDPTMLCSRRS